MRVKNRRSKIQGFVYMSLLIGATTPWVQPQQRAAGEATLNTYISAGDGACFPPGLLTSPSINHNGGGMRRAGENFPSGKLAESPAASACLLVSR